MLSDERLKELERDNRDRFTLEADAIRELLAAYAATREKLKVVHEALRQVAVREPAYRIGCAVCKQSWIDDREAHKLGCIARPNFLNESSSPDPVRD